MGKLFCLSVFGRKTKATKAKLDTSTVRMAKDISDQHGFVAMDSSLSIGLAPPTSKSHLVLDSPDSCSTCSDTAGPKDVQSEQKICLAEKHEATDLLVVSWSSCADSQLDSQHQVNVRSEPVEVLTETGGGSHSMTSLSLSRKQNCLGEAFASANELTSGSGDECLGLFLQHSEKPGMDSQGECADESGAASEVSDSESNRQSCEGLSRPLCEDTSLPAHCTEYFGTPYQCVLPSGLYSEGGAEQLPDQRGGNVRGQSSGIFCNQMDSLYLFGADDLSDEGIYEDIALGGAPFVDSPDGAIFNLSNSDRIAMDDDMLTGHVSDPGVYVREELQSRCESPALHNDGCMGQSIDMKRTASLQNFEAEVHKPKSTVVGDAIEDTSIEVDGHARSLSELTFHSADKVMLKPESSSKVLSFSKRKSWWKVFMVSHRNIHREVLHQASDAVTTTERPDKQPCGAITGYTSDICEAGQPSEYIGLVTHGEASAAPAGQHSGITEKDGYSELEVGLQASSGTSVWSSNQWIAFPSTGSTLSRVEEWISNIQQPDVPFDGADFLPQGTGLGKGELTDESGAEDVSIALRQTAGALTHDAELAKAAVRSLNLLSTVAHIAGIGLREVPSLGMFNCLKTLNLSGNCIARVPAGSLPRSLHSLDLSRNRISVIEGFRELSRLRILNLSYNRISRIGHGLANCSVIKELYLAGNKIAEVEGLHRLLKLSVLDLSFNKLTTSKALGQLAANYSSLLALNLLGNPVQINLGEEQLRKLVMRITPHVTYLNRQPIKPVSAREAVVDSVARAALGTSQRSSKASSSRAQRRVAGQSVSQKNKTPSHHAKDVEKRRKSAGAELPKSTRLPRQQQRHRHYHQSDGQHAEKYVGKEHRHSSRPPVSVHDHLLRKLSMDTGSQVIHRSRSESALQEQGLWNGKKMT